MKASFFFVPLAFSLFTLSGKAAEPAAKLVPRPLPGVKMPQLAPAAEGTAASSPQAAPSSAATGIPAPNGGARILFIHRRATLPPALTADLAKPSTGAGNQRPAASAADSARPGRIRIIPKAEVAALLPPLQEPKPSQP